MKKGELLRRLSVQSENLGPGKDSDTTRPERPRTAGAKAGGRSRGKPAEKYHSKNEGTDIDNPEGTSKSKPPTAPKPRPKTKVPTKVDKTDPPMPEWKREHIVTLINSSPFPSYTKSIRLAGPTEPEKEKEVGTKTRSTQSKVKMNSRLIQVAPSTASTQQQTSSFVSIKDSGPKETYECPGPHIKESTITEINDNLNYIFDLIKDIDEKSDNVKEKEEEILHALENTPQINIDFLREVPEQINALHEMIKGNGRGDGKYNEIIPYLEEKFSNIQEELEKLKQELERQAHHVPAPIIQAPNGDGNENIALYIGSIENTVRTCHKDIVKSMQQLLKDISDTKRQVMQLNVERQVSLPSDPNSEQILTTVKDIHTLLLPKGTVPRPSPQLKEPYSGPCRCEVLRSGIPKQRNTSSHLTSAREETVDLCQKCLNEYRGRVFINIWDLPLSTNPSLHAVLGQILECLDYDNNVNLSLLLHDFISQCPGWTEESLTECYLALFTVSLGWSNVRCPLIIANYLDINTLIETQFGKHLRDQDTILDVMGQLLCRLDPASKRASITSPYLSGLLFNAVKSRNIVAFNFLVINKSPLDEIRGGRSVLHEIAHQSSIHKEDTDAQQRLLKMLDILYDQAGAWWEAQSKVCEDEETSSNNSTSENESSESESSSVTAAITRDSYPTPIAIHKREIGEDFKINALRYLLSMRDDRGRNPLQYAVRCAAPGIVQKMLSEQPYKCVPDPMEFTFDTHRYCFVVDDIDGSIAPRGTSALDMILTRPRNDKSIKLLSSEPFKSMIRDRWQRYYLFGWLWCFVYLFYMAVYTTCAVHRPVNRRSLSDMYETASDKARAVGEVFVLLGLTGFIYAEVRDFLRLGWVWPWPWTFSGLPRLVNLSFLILTITVMILRLTENENEDIPLSLALIFGWINAVYFLVLWEEARLLPVILHNIVFKDFFARFFWLFLLVIVATSSATFCVYQNAGAQFDGLDGQNIWQTPFVLYQLFFGFGDTNYAGQARNTGIGYTLFLFHVGFVGFIVVNVMVAMVIHTYIVIKREEASLSLWLKAWMVQLLDRRLVPGLGVKYHRGRGCMDRLRPGHIRYQLRYSLRKDAQGQVTEVPEHVVMIAPEGL